MADYDVFNGDADGICALLQLRNAEPRDSKLITGVKRDISLLKQIFAQPGDRITVLDISLDKNREALGAALDSGAEVFYADHHFAGDIPNSPALEALINTEPNVCTSMLVNSRLRGKFIEWALVGTFGDNLRHSALELAKPLDLTNADLGLLERLGTYINYNGYGASIDDLHFAPADLFQLLREYRTPLDFIRDDRPTFKKLEFGFNDDMDKAGRTESIFVKPHAAVFMLPDKTWARRVSGVYSNDLANEHPERAHAVVTEREGQGYLVSVRAPLSNKTGADEICRQFPTGGGRKAAAGINDLPVEMLDEFISTLSNFYT